MKKKKASAKTSDAVDILLSKGSDSEIGEMVREEYLNRAISSQLFELRSRQKLTQKELALKVGTTQSVIARLEDSNYDGHSLNMLSRIAKALGYTVVVQFEPAGEADGVKI